MNKLEKNILKYYLPRLVKKKCEDRVKKSDKPTNRTNCYAVFLHDGDDPHFFVEDYINELITCSIWDGSKYSEVITVSINDIDHLSLRIEHFYGFHYISYIGIVDFFVDRLIPVSFIKIHFGEKYDSIAQTIFNRRSLQTRARFDFLKLLTKKFIGKNNGFGYVDVMSEMHTFRSFVHPNFHKEASTVLAYLDGFVDTKELVMKNSKYHLTGQVSMLV